MFDREAIPYEAAFLAGKSFLAYRRHGGAKRSPLPDFFIGAHAAVAGYRLLTRDAARYRRIAHAPTASRSPRVLAAPPSRSRCHGRRRCGRRRL
jgi:hypothetical protein